MPAKLDAHSNLRFLYACFKHSNYTTVAYGLVAGEFGIKPPAARMRLMRLKGVLDALSSSSSSSSSAASSSSAPNCRDDGRKGGGKSGAFSDTATATGMDKEGAEKAKGIGKSGKTAAKDKKGKACAKGQGTMADDDYDDDDDEEEEFLMANRKRVRELRVKVEDGVEDGRDGLDDDEPLAKRRRMHDSRHRMVKREQQSPYHGGGVCKLEDCDEESAAWLDKRQCLQDKFVDVKVEEDVGGSLMAMKQEDEEGLDLQDKSVPDYLLQEDDVESQGNPPQQGKEKAEVEVDEDMLDDILVTDDSASWRSHATAVSELGDEEDDNDSFNAEEPMFDNITLEN